MIGKIISGVIGGFMVAVLGALVVTIAMANEPETGGSNGAVAFFVFWVLGIMISIIAKDAGKAWRHLLLLSALLSFALPLSSFIFSGAAVSQAIVNAGDQVGAAATGAVIGGGLITAVSGFLGFFLGVIFLIVGLLVGRDKQIVVVQQQPERT